jgi:hypothetical protein
MKLLNAISLLCLGLLLGLGARLAWGAATMRTINCAAADVCTIQLGAGHWIILTPHEQTIDMQEINNETGYRIETPRQGRAG